VIDHLAGKVTCREFTEEVTNYLEGSLGILKWVRFQMHLGMCPGCRAYLKQMKQTIQTLEKLPDRPVHIPPAVREELLRRFQSWKSGQ
jgi:predicted anti-sigma-YlaC factor YlaD